MTARNSGNGRKQRLELTWIGKDERPRLEPRILMPVVEHCHENKKLNKSGLSDNILIQGDNLLALKALEQDYAGRVKCVFIDPPYNTGSAFEHYDDGLEHSLWLSLIRDRLDCLKSLLANNGSIWITIDDSEAHYLKVVCDEAFGRANFIANVIWQKRFAPNSTAQFLSDSHDHVLVYAKDKSQWNRNLLPRDERQNANYKNPDNDPRGPWTSGDLSARNSYSAGIYPVTTPSGRLIEGPPRGMYWRVSREKLAQLDADGRIWWGRNGSNVPRLKRFLSEVMDGVVPQTVWLQTDVGNTQEAKKEVMAVVPKTAEVFQTPKPERLLRQILEIATNPGDIVLDSFAGSGTTGAVAHKMGRRWIMVELGDHAQSHIVPRLRKVIDGEDRGGVTEAVDWKGGGGFRFYRLAPSLIETDKFGQKVISKHYNPEMLAEAMCKHMGFIYAPSQDPECYWQHGHSTEHDFIYVTTQALTHDGLRALSLAVGEDRSLLVCCKAFRARLADFPNLTVKKIPQAVLDKCEWGRDDYSLNISAQPEEESSGSDDDPEDGDGGGSETASVTIGHSDGNTQPTIEASERRAKKAPLKMDGTTRTRKPKASKVEPTVVATDAPSEAKNSKTARSSRKTTKAAKAPKKAAAKKAVKKPKPEAGRPAAKSPKKPKTTAKPSRTRKSRNTVEQAQGRLL